MRGGKSRETIPLPPVYLFFSSCGFPMTMVPRMDSYIELLTGRTKVTQLSFVPMMSCWCLFTKHFLDACPLYIRHGYSGRQFITFWGSRFHFQCFGDVHDLQLNWLSRGCECLTSLRVDRRLFVSNETPFLLGYLDLLLRSSGFHPGIRFVRLRLFVFLSLGMMQISCMELSLGSSFPCLFYVHTHVHAKGTRAEA